MSTDKIIIFDTTLRDGEQCPGASLNNKEKLEIAKQLALLKVDVIEAGFPAASPGDFDSVKQIAEAIRNVSIAGLARALPKDIESVARSLEKADKPRIHIFLSTSKTHRDHKLQKDKGQIVKMAREAIRLGRTYCDDIEFSPEDASRTEPDFLAEVVEAVISEGAGTVNIPDTVGYSVPEQFASLIRDLKTNVPNIDQAILSVHCHNDLGMAVANSLAAVKAGARQVECTLNGIGERAGNAAMEEIVMAIKTRKDYFGVDTRIDTKHIMAASKLVSSLTGFFVQRNKAIVGKNAFAHESGVHQDGFLKKKDTYEIMNPSDIGLDSSELVLGKHSGRNALSDRITKMGFKLEPDEVSRVFTKFKLLADEKKEIFDEDILSLIREDSLQEETQNAFSLVKIKFDFESGETPEALVTLKNQDGQEYQGVAKGDGPIDAIYNAIDKITGLTLRLLDYQVLSKTKGKDAQGDVTVRVLHDRREVMGKSHGVNTIEASGLAYVNAVNKLIINPPNATLETPDILGP